MSVGVVIVAAGSGSRLGASVPKAFVCVAGRPLLEYAVRSALSCRPAALVVAAPTTHVDDALTLVEPLSREHGIPVQVVPGGAERGDSVLAGVRWLPEACDVVLVHDAARAFTPSGVFQRVAAAVSEAVPAVVPVMPLIDTVKVVDADGFVVSTPDRATLRIVQTPQGFRRDVLLAAHAAHGSLATDDAALVELLGLRVGTVPGDPDAIKVTTPEDLAYAERLLASAARG
jgi:2-C-methyl-D-erythritol 4-phosphate cytidylyltransferase